MGTVYTITLVRHAKAPKTSPDQKDEDRVLNQVGLEQAARLGVKLRGMGMNSNAVLSSPLIRAVETLRIATGNQKAITTVPALTCATGPDSPIDIMFNELGYVPMTKYFEHPLGEHLKEWGRTALEAVIGALEPKPNQEVLVGGHAVLQNALLWAIFETLQDIQQEGTGDFRVDGAECAEKMALEINLGDAEAFKFTRACHEAGMCSCEHIKLD